MATCDPAPPHLPDMQHSDYEAGHLPRIAGIPFEQFLTLADQPELRQEILHQYTLQLLEDLANDLALPPTDLPSELAGLGGRSWRPTISPSSSACRAGYA